MLTPEMRAKLDKTFVPSPSSSTSKMATDDEVTREIARMRNLREAVKPKEEPGFFSTLSKNVGNFAIGVGKGIAELPAQAARAGSELAEMAGETDIGKKAGEGIRSTLGKVISPETATAIKEGAEEGLQRTEQQLQPVGEAQKAGALTEDVAELFTPTGLEKTALKAVPLVTKWTKAPVIKTGAELLAKVGAEGLGATGITFLQTGDIEQAKDTGLIAGATRGALGVAGEALRKAKIPEKVYGKIFRDSYADTYKTIKSQGLENFAKTNPERFEDLVKNGAVKVIDGKVTINETLAKQALDKGLKGSLKKMSNETVKNLVEAENTVKNIAQKSKNVISLSKADSFDKVLLDIAQDYEGVAGNKISEQALKLAAKAESGNLNALDALEMRRFLDKMRISSSYQQLPGKKLSLSQENLKYLTDKLRGQINKIDGMQEAMDDYSFNIDALEALAKESKRVNDKAAISLFDNFVISGGLMSGEPATAIAVGVGKRILNQPGVMTKTASKIQKGESTPFGRAIRTGVSQYLTGGQD